MGKSELLHVLTENVLFEGFPKEDLKKLADLGRTVQFSAGTELFKAGDPSHAIYVLLRGTLDVKRNNSTVATVQDKGVVGEMGVITQQPRSADVVVAKDCTLLVLAREPLFALVENNPELGLRFYRNISTILIDYLRKNNLLLEFFQSMELTTN